MTGAASILACLSAKHEQAPGNREFQMAIEQRRKSRGVQAGMLAAPVALAPVFNLDQKVMI